MSSIFAIKPIPPQYSIFKLIPGIQELQPFGEKLFVVFDPEAKKTAMLAIEKVLKLIDEYKCILATDKFVNNSQQRGLDRENALVLVDLTVILYVLCPFKQPSTIASVIFRIEEICIAKQMSVEKVVESIDVFGLLDRMEANDLLC